MTGYMDPRLAMMGSTFMPSASGAFPAGAGGGGPQFGGASLQQSIAQHNEASVDHPLSAFLGLSRSRNASSTTRSSALGILLHPASSTARRRSRYSVPVDSIRMTWQRYGTNSVTFMCECCCSFSRTGCSPTRLTEGNSTEKNSMSQWV
jgi:hypothetical protein